MNNNLTGYSNFWVVKASKLCNLRCSYCYEWDELGDPKKLSLELWRNFFSGIRHLSEEAKVERKSVSHKLILHGGEPLILPLNYLQSIMDIATDYGGDDLDLQNCLQTNLYSITEEKIQYLKENRFRIGVSFDGVPGTRLSVAGKTTEDQVVKNMEIILRNGINYGCICVVGRHNENRLVDIFNFFYNLRISFRFLPVFDVSQHVNQSQISVNYEATANRLFEVFVIWISKKETLSVRPFLEWLEISLRFLSKQKIRESASRVEGPTVTLVNTDGKLYRVPDAYTAGLEFGDLEYGLPMSFGSKQHRKSVQREENEVNATCNACTFRDYCDSSFIVSSRPERTKHCGVDYLVISKIVRWLGENADHFAMAFEIMSPDAEPIGPELQVLA
ncbi:radical SAM protein [Ruegeria sp. 2205SS24-7]|uniref:radical SAM protein n=1 Tax=Ruegeria discodermiae TaxID=3064389 RepID=UPI0027421FCE|nr:radical SAM protein [Ruegeria sp. 2205SS24-7]MDP5220371.1 radical SAM protein [Ruegeria sp. 2205SS24-7]